MEEYILQDGLLSSDDIIISQVDNTFVLLSKQDPKDEEAPTRSIKKENLEKAKMSSRQITSECGK